MFLHGCQCLFAFSLGKKKKKTLANTGTDVFSVFSLFVTTRRRTQELLRAVKKSMALQTEERKRATETEMPPT